ncbi:kinase [Corynebacterium yudongzhengii]|uniref:DAK2 domain-containing protein n=1 Tax=Corynebacterium yudongzhengii TaxID=2080740 RepID=A0A2U1T941_9CORY|nr:DAK2 domain-containing protein [Corynebacterium yudongzhengii]AWB82030.1 kinase [Corynebacterium yudongzhengii]PWC02534.1 DAK2 domain-containing protein [Corynebacterium yudongzhengii]
MTTLAPLTGTHLRRWTQRVVAELGDRRSEINALNVFPVPDADTGSNMMHTMEAALAEVDALDPAEAEELAAVVRALATGSIRGARGNSGVVLSQVLRGIDQAVDAGEFTASTFADALAIAVGLVDKAISEPVEGTVVTVLRAATVAAQDARDDGGELTTVVSAAVDAARTALANTPSQLAVLREAGVVDAGGAGLVILLETFYAEVLGSSPDAPDPHSVAPAASEHAQPANLEVMFLFTADENTVSQLESELAEFGDSLTVARGEGEATFHIHSLIAGQVIETAFQRGAVSNLRIEVLPDTPVVHTEKPERLLLALTPPGAVADLYRTAGAEVIEVAGTGSDGEDDPVGAVLSLIRRTRAGEIVLLPNGLLSRRQLVAVDNATHAFEQSITLLPTSRLVSGIAAVGMHTPEEPLATTSYAMSEAAAAMRTATVVRAERAALTAAGPCARGDILVEVLGEIVVVAESVAEAVERAAHRLLESGGEQVTVLTVEPLDGEKLSEALGADVMVFDGTGLTATGLVAEIGVE